jgi:hypothetical protein
MELGWHGHEYPQANENALAKTGCYFGTEVEHLPGGPCGFEPLHHHQMPGLAGRR